MHWPERKQKLISSSNSPFNSPPATQIWPHFRLEYAYKVMWVLIHVIKGSQHLFFLRVPWMALDVLVLTAIFGSKSQSHLNPSLLGPAHHLASPPCGCSLSGRLFPGRPHSWLSMNRGKSLLEPEALRGGCHTPSGAPQPSLLQGNTLPASPESPTTSRTFSPCRVFFYFPKSRGFQNIAVGWTFIIKKISEKSVFLTQQHPPFLTLVIYL